MNRLPNIDADCSQKLVRPHAGAATNVRQSHFSALSLFSNCGAGDLGFRRSGFRFGVLAELDPRRLEVAMGNHLGAFGVPGDLRETWPLTVHLAQAALEQPLDLLSACPPCQGMSTARSDRGAESDPDAGTRDQRNLLVVPIAEVANRLKPRVIVVENVPAFLRRHVRNPSDGQPISAAALLVSRLAEHYVPFPLLTDLADFGVPQTRKRSFLTFILKTEPVTDILTRQRLSPYPIPRFASDHGGECPVTLRSFLADMGLSKLDAYSADTAADKTLALHRVPIIEGKFYAMVRAIPPGSGRSAWQNQECVHCGKLDIGDEQILCPSCNQPVLRPIVPDGDSGYRFVNGFRRSSYRRLSLDLPASTVTTASGRISSDRTIHPTENRVLSLLECAMLQTFPEDFRWGPALSRWGDGSLREMIGEAVPPLFTELHGRVLRTLLEGTVPEQLLSQDDVRCKKAKDKIQSDLDSNRN
jgi:DNA (cytosine-5)-methyltransferase 1